MSVTSFPKRPARRRPLLVVVALLATFAVGGTTVSVADAQTRPDRSVDRVAVQADDIEELRLRCRVDSIGGERGVLCRWSKAAAQNVRAYLVYRIVDGEARELIASVPADGRRAAFDRNVVPGVAHIYGVVAVDAEGRAVAISGPRHVRWPTTR